MKRRLALALAGLLLASLAADSRLRGANAGPAAASVHSGHVMSDQAMQDALDEWYAAHPPRGAGSAAAAADTFIASGTRFDTDGSGLTQVDTARILVGETILWRQTLGIHTTTNGTDSSDPEAGFEWDQPLNGTTPTFSFTFNSEGTFPFFCRFHEFFNMKGVVVVRDPLVGVRRVTEGGDLGFSRGPSPNPTRAAVTFRFALRAPGRARAEVLDAGGRRVAVPVDRALESGTYAADWDGKTRAGERARAGVYYLRLSVPGHTQSRRFVIVP